MFFFSGKKHCQTYFRFSHIGHENFKTHTEVYDGLIARVVQHEYDHIEGVLFTDKLSSFKKRLIKGKLTNISKGKIQVDYRMRFPLMKKKR